MERREFLKMAAVGVASTALSSCSPLSKRNVRSGKHPNILVICSDEHHPLKSGYRGHPHVKTPNLDKLAAEGAYFTRAYCNNPIR